jgi:hypothetical protein
MIVASPAIADDASAHSHRRSTEIAPVVQEWDTDGTAIEQPPTVGTARLLRRASGLTAAAEITGLQPGGVYTFWWVVVQEDGTFPDDIFVASGDGTIAGRNGRATARMSASLGQASIMGFIPDGVNEITFAPLTDPLGAVVRIEIAYHGQAVDAGGDLLVWLGDFWTGDACPPDTPNPNPAQPHCPVYYAATFG